MNIYNQPIRALASVQWPWRGNGPDRGFRLRLVNIKEIANNILKLYNSEYISKN